MREYKMTRIETVGEKKKEKKRKAAENKRQMKRSNFVWGDAAESTFREPKHKNKDIGWGK